MTTSWQFFAVTARTPSEFTWQWRKQDASKPAVTGPLFDFYFDCISDARQNGYAGPLPAGPSIALVHLPVAAGSGSAAGAKHIAGELGMKVVGRARVKGRRSLTA